MAVFDIVSVLDLNAFERQNKAEGLGMVSEEGTSEYDLQPLTVPQYLNTLSSKQGDTHTYTHRNTLPNTCFPISFCIDL